MRPLEINKRGFTLIEILLALLVITIGVVAVTGLLGASLETSSRARDDLRAVSFSDLVLNYLHPLDFDAIPDHGTLSIPGHDQTPISIQIGNADPARLTVAHPDSNLTRGESPREYGVAYRLRVTNESDLKALTLEVWPGFNTREKARVFHTEIHNWNQRP